MRKAGWASRTALFLTLAACGCAQDVTQRVRDYNEDGVHLYCRGDYRNARESFQAALNLQPDDPGLQFNLGQCYDHLGDVAQAEKYYDDCLAHAPDHVECNHALALLLVRTQRTAQAGKHVEAWLASSPKLAAAHAEDGWLWHLQGDLPRAQARLQEALLINPNEWHALTELGNVYEEMQRPDRAAVLYQQSLAVHSDQPDVRKRLAQLKAEGAGPPRRE